MNLDAVVKSRKCSYLDVKTLEAHLPDFRPKRVVLTHLKTDMIGRDYVGFEVAVDGKMIEL